MTFLLSLNSMVDRPWAMSKLDGSTNASKKLVNQAAREGCLLEIHISYIVIMKLTTIAEKQANNKQLVQG